MLELVISSLKIILRFVLMTSIVVIVFPKLLDHVDSRGIASHAVSIKLNQKSLAYMALTDSRANLEEEFQFENTNDPDGILSQWGQVTLNAGTDGSSVVEQILAPPSQNETEFPQNKDGEKNQLTGMVISQSQSIHNNIVLAMTTPLNKDIESIPLKNVYGKWESLEVRKGKILAATSPETIRQPQIKDKAKLLVEQALKEKKAAQFRRVIKSQTGGQILVSRVETSGLKASIPKSKSAKQKSNSESGLGQESVEPSAGISPTEWKDYHQRPIVISGQLRFANGLAYTGQHHLSISRVIAGETQETGKIWIRDAYFEIPVKRAKGYLIAEMHDPSGMLVAYQEFDLNKLPAVPKDQYKVTNFDIKLQPVSQGAIVKVISGYSYDNKDLPVENATVVLEPFGSELPQEESGEFVERSLEKGSDIIVKVSAEKHWSTLARVTSGAVATLRVFHESMMNALIDIVSLNESERKINRQKGVIWGIILDKGRPVNGAKVEISGDTGPISYINKIYLPDVALGTTSENGMFTVVGAGDGLQSIRVTYKGKQYPAQVIKTIGGHVSFVEINFDKLQTVSLEVADAFGNDIPMNATIRSLGSDVIMENIGSRQDIQSQKHPLSFHLLEADAGLDYEMIRVEEPLSQHFIKFPMVQRSWVQGIKSQHRINSQVDTGIIIGWISDMGFEVFLNDGKQFGDLSYIYFNENGQVVSKDQSPSGFIIYNVPTGQHTITVVPHSRKTVMTKVLTVDSDFISIFNR